MAKKKTDFFDKKTLEVMKKLEKVNKKQRAERTKYIARYGDCKKVLKSMESARRAIEVHYKNEKDSPLDKSLDIPEIKKFQKKFQKESAAFLKFLVKVKNM